MTAPGDKKNRVRLVHDVPVRSAFDVVVAGAGLGGVSAAVAAAEAGARTLLIEKNGYPGGVATAGMCCSVFNCYYTPSHELIVKGNALRFVDRLAQETGYGAEWREHKGHIIYDLERAKLVLSELLEEAGAAYLLDALVTDVIREDDRVAGIIVASKSGVEAIAAGAVVDATGDADVAAAAGAPLRHIGEDGRARHSYNFRLGGVDVERFVAYLRQHPQQYPPYMDVDWTFDEADAHYRATGTFLFPHGGGEQLDLIQKGVASDEYPTISGVYDSVDALQMHMIRDMGVAHVITGFTDIDSLDVAAITRAMTDGKRMARRVTDYFQRYVPGFESALLIGTADDLGLRATRWIEGELDFTPEMRSTPTTFPDAVARGVVQRNYKKNPSPRAWGVQSFDEGIFEIPYRCLLPRGIEGLVMGSGRSVSAANPMLLRVMAHTMAVGQAAGVAAAVAVRQGVTPRSVDVGLVQEELVRQGVDLG
jgi:hypothetical protein